MQTTQFAAKRVNGQWEAALIVNNKFNRAGFGGSVVNLFTRLCGPLLEATDSTDGSEIAINVTTVTAREAAEEPGK